MFCHDGPFLQNTSVSLPPVLPSQLFLSAITSSTAFIHPRLLLFSLLPPVSLFLPTLPAVSPSLSLCSSVILPRLFYLPQSFFLPICFLFSAVSSTALLCFSSSDPTLEHLREIRRKLASENLQLKAPVPRLLSRSQCNILTHSDLVRVCLRNKLLVVAHV